MTRHYWVNSADVTDITGPWLEGQVVLDSAGRQVTGNLGGPVPSAGIYLAIEDNSPTPAYYTRIADTLAFEGVVGADASRVRETRNFEQQSIEDVYQQKRADIRNYDETVRYNAVDTALNTNWWVVVTRTMRTEIDGVQGSWSQRQHNGQSWPTGPNAPWLGIYNASTGKARRYQITDANTWNTLYDEKTQHDQACGNATDASAAALDLAYDDGLGDWNDVANHDPRDPAWGYPPTVEISQEARVVLGG